MTPWPCHRCGAPAIKHLGVNGYCLAHLVELLRTFNPAAFGELGMMLPAGQERPDWGPGMCDCRCARCGATHIAAPLEACPWCTDAALTRDRHQVELLLTPPTVGPGEGRTAALTAWAKRLGRAVNAGLVDERTARRALEREVNAA